MTKLSSAKNEEVAITNSPLGPLKLIADDKYLLSIEFLDSVSPRVALEKSKNSVILKTIQQLREYFSGERKEFQLPLRPMGTDFQMKAWQQLQKIPYGKTISYQEQAKRMKRPTAMRAVGSSNGKNPLPIVIPCHRVIGKNGSLTGFSSGLDKKRFLLELEARF